MSVRRSRPRRSARACTTPRARLRLRPRTVAGKRALARAESIATEPELAFTAFGYRACVLHHARARRAPLGGCPTAVRTPAADRRAIAARRGHALPRRAHARGERALELRVRMSPHAPVDRAQIGVAGGVAHGSAHLAAQRELTIDLELRRSLALRAQRVVLRARVSRETSERGVVTTSRRSRVD